MTFRLPIRWRLTFWQVLLLTAALLLFGAALYFGLRRALYENFEEQVRNEAAFALAGVSLDGNMLQIAPSALAQLEDDDHFVRLVDSAGTIVFDTSDDLGGVPLDQDQIDRALAGSPSFTTYHGASEPVGIATYPIESGEEIAGALQVGTTRGDTDEVLRLILLAMAISGPIVLAVAAAGSYLLAGKALEPVDAITSLAADLNATDLTQRLNLDLPDDELGRLAATFDAMLERVETAFDQQRRFTSDAAHELRTPLAAMRGEIDIVLTRPRSGMEYQQAMDDIGGDVDRMSRLVATLLALSRGDNGHLSMDRTTIELDNIIAATLEQYRDEASDEGILLHNESTPVTCEADSALIVQLLTNLIDNALAHTPSGGAVSVGCQESAGHARLWVGDTGSGIPPEHQSKVFDRFYRVDPGRTRERGGAGLGLSIAKSIVDLHHGTINLTSAPGAGTRVEIEFPCAQPDVSPSSGQ